MIVIPGLSESLTAVGKQIVGFETTDTKVSADVSSSALSAQCPKCSQQSSRTHGKYRRQIRAQACTGRAVSLSVEVRRFKCVNPLCAQRTFVERIDALAPPRQRRTVGLNDAVRSVAHALGGTAAARLSAKLGMPVSRDTLLRELRRASAVFTTDVPVVVGIDDWAITRGHRLRDHRSRP
jgi:transposase